MSRSTADENEVLVLAGPGSPAGEGGERRSGVPGNEEGISNRPDDEEEDFDADDDEEDDEEVDDADELTEPD